MSLSRVDLTLLIVADEVIDALDMDIEDPLESFMNPTVNNFDGVRYSVSVVCLFYPELLLLPVGHDSQCERKRVSKCQCHE